MIIPMLKHNNIIMVQGYNSGVGSNKKVGGHTNWQDEWVGPKATACGN